MVLSHSAPARPAHHTLANADSASNRLYLTWRTDGRGADALAVGGGTRSRNNYLWSSGSASAPITHILPNATFPLCLAVMLGRRFLPLGRSDLSFIITTCVTNVANSETTRGVKRKFTPLPTCRKNPRELGMKSDPISSACSTLIYGISGVAVRMKRDVKSRPPN